MLELVSRTEMTLEKEKTEATRTRSAKNAWLAAMINLFKENI